MTDHIQKIATAPQMVLHRGANGGFALTQIERVGSAEGAEVLGMYTTALDLINDLMRALIDGVEMSVAVGPVEADEASPALFDCDGGDQ